MESQAAAPNPSTSDAALVARVVAWHNRHPLARRITPEQVQGLGVVAVPFTPQGRRATLKPAIGERFLPRWLQWSAARFASRFAVIARPGEAAWPQRDVQPAARRLGPDGSTQWRYLTTAAIEVGDQRRRVLLSPAPDGAVLGQHLWDRPRLLASLAAALTAAGLVAALWQVVGRHAPGAELVAGTSAASATAHSTSEPGTDAASAPAHTSTHAAGHASPASASADAHVATAKALGSEVSASAAGTESASIRPHFDDAAVRAGRLELAEARARRAAAALVQHEEMQAFALVSSPRRSRDEAESAAAALRDALSRNDLGTAARIEAVAAGGQWRVVWWPFVTADDAQEAQARLRRDGVVLGLVAF